jgi:hypothetical protein
VSEASHPARNHPVHDSSQARGERTSSALQAVQEALDLRDNGGAASSGASAVISKPPAAGPAEPAPGR